MERDKKHKYNMYHEELEKVPDIILKNFKNEIDSLSDEEMESLYNYLSQFTEKNRKWDLDKTKILFLLLNNISGDSKNNILSFLEQKRYGWDDDKYNHINKCKHIDALYHILRPLYASCELLFCFSKEFSDTDLKFVERNCRKLFTMDQKNVVGGDRKVR